ncbi:MAG: hypothetical protein EOP81_04740 [Variovorax sp.]|nr:MAG: hypothetical protein EOP81_04740 [Variovorax sp.]
MALLFQIALGISPAFGGDLPADCTASPLISVNELRRTACRKLESISIEVYLSPKPPSPYATEFDQRELAIAYGRDEVAVKAAVGATKEMRARIRQSRILQPPRAAQVSAIELSQRTQKYGAWTVSTEEVQYGTQGGGAGFALNCATAIRSTRKATVAVSECFPFEGKDRFVDAFSSIRGGA